MIPTENSFDAFLNSVDRSPETLAQIEATNESDALAKINNVMRFIEANNKCGDARLIVNKFNLAWSLGKDYGNGVSKVEFYTDESLRYHVMDLHLPTSEWFR